MTVADFRDRWSLARLPLIASPRGVTGSSARRGPVVAVDLGGAPSHTLSGPRDGISMGQVIAADLISACVAVLIGSLLWQDVDTRSLIALAGVWLLALGTSGAYRRPLVRRAENWLGAVTTAAVRTCAGLAVLAVLVPQLPIAALVGSTLVAAAATAGARHSVRRRAEVHSPPRVRTLVRGPSTDVERLVQQLERDHTSRFCVAAIQVTDGSVPEPLLEAGPAVLAATADTVVSAVQLELGAVLLAGMQSDSSEELRRMLWGLESCAVEAHLVPIVADIAVPRVRKVSQSGAPMVSFDARDTGAETGIGKVLVDKVLALAALVVISPVILVTALAVLISSPGPAIFRQIRIGRGGVPFEMLKFRTMDRDAEAQRSELEAMNVHAAGTLFKIPDDPRVTPIGKVLRRYSLDELPQLVNVLKGDMSLVGPRPPLPEEVAAYPLDAHRRMRVRPGLTGLWQVSGRSDLDCTEAVRLDTVYVEQWSVAMDVGILARTPRAVLSSKGAY